MQFSKFKFPTELVRVLKPDPLVWFRDGAASLEPAADNCFQLNFYD